MAYLRANPGDDWKKLGKIDPYFGVLSGDEFKSGNIDADGKARFFDTGERHVEKLLGVISKHFPDMRVGSALDYGCGVGRITCALASRFDDVVGVDISQAMLDEAGHETAQRGHPNVAYRLSGSTPSLGEAAFDLVHTYIVLQHIPPAIGYGIIGQMIDALRVNGVGAVHFTVAGGRSGLKSKTVALVKNILPLRIAGNIFLGKKWDYPAMQMNAYDFTKVMGILARRGIFSCQVLVVQDWENTGYFMFFQKPDAGAGRPPWYNPADGRR